MSIMLLILFNNVDKIRDKIRKEREIALCEQMQEIDYHCAQYRKAYGGAHTLEYSRPKRTPKYPLPVRNIIHVIVEMASFQLFPDRIDRFFEQRYSSVCFVFCFFSAAAHDFSVCRKMCFYVANIKTPLLIKIQSGEKWSFIQLFLPAAPRAAPVPAFAPVLRRIPFPPFPRKQPHRLPHRLRRLFPLLPYPVLPVS